MPSSQHTVPSGSETNHSALPIRSLAPATQAVHADDHLNRSSDVAPPLHVSTTFRYARNPSELVPAKELDASTQNLLQPTPVSLPYPTPNHCPSTTPLNPLNPPTPPKTLDAHIYSRETAPSTTRLEAILAPLLHAPTITYSSGLAALHALYVFLNPRRVAIGGGYHGSHGVLRIMRKVSGLQLLPLDCAADDLRPGDVIHLETPENPTGEARGIAAYAAKAQARGAFLLVDSTFGPPGLQEPFSLGADVVMHSGTKYLGGHSDMLCGVLATRNEDWVRGLREERTHLGSVMGGMEAWLAVRSVRTLSVRVRRQSESATKLVAWLHSLVSKPDSGFGKLIERVQHASLQKQDLEHGWLREQMHGGFGPVFAICMRDEGLARKLPSCLELFQHATSLGGVESLIEWRAMSDSTVDTRLLRVSVGLEAWEDLRGDLEGGFRKVAGGGEGG